MQLVYAPKDIEGLQSVGLRGVYDPIEALTLMIDGTGLVIGQTGSDTLTIGVAAKAVASEIVEQPEASRAATPPKPAGRPCGRVYPGPDTGMRAIEETPASAESR